MRKRVWVLLAVAVLVLGGVLPFVFLRAVGAQGLTWVRQFGAEGQEIAFDVAVDGAGNPVVAGFWGLNAFVRKYDSNGNALWTNQLSTGFPGQQVQAQAVAADPVGNVYIAGFVFSVLPGQTAAGGGDAFVAKYDPNGISLWVRQFGTSAMDSAWGVGVDGTGNVYVMGDTGGAFSGQASAGGFDGFIRKYDANGNELWTRQFGSPAMDIPVGGAVDAAGNALASGWTEGAFPGQTSAGGVDVFVVRYDTNGNLLWVRQFGTSANDNWARVAADAAGNVLVGGTTEGVLPGQTGSGGADIFLRKYNAAGVEQWTRQFGSPSGDTGRDVATGNAGDVYVVATTMGVVGQGSSGGTDAVVRRYDSNGNVLFTHQFGTAGNEQAEGVAFVPAPPTVYAAGSTDGTFPGQTLAGFVDAFLAKLQAPTGADLSVTKVATPTTTTVGGAFTFTQTVTNNGPAPASGVSLTDEMPAGVAFVSVSATQGSCTQAGAIVTCALGVLSNGASATVTIAATAVAVGTWTNTVTVTAATSDPTPANNTAAVQVIVTSGQPPTPVPSEVFLYSVKYVCGVVRPLAPKPAIPTLTDPLSVVPGVYRTAINIHNFSNGVVTLSKKAVVARPQNEPRGAISGRVQDTLRPNEALEVNCPDIVRLLGPVTGDFVTGFVEIESGTELEVTTVYTLEELLEQGISIDVEHKSPYILRRGTPVATPTPTPTPTPVRPGATPSPPGPGGPGGGGPAPTPIPAVVP